MIIHQIRNATIIVTYNGKKILIDPWLMPKNHMKGFEVGVNSHIRQPRVELPISIEEIVNVDAVILTHFHPDHFDEFAVNALDKNIPFFVQSEYDLAIIKNFGFNNVQVLTGLTEFFGIILHKTDCQHGKRELIEPLCKKMNIPYEAMGVIFQAANEKTLYISGDTIWCNEVIHTLETYQPEVIVVNACGATVLPHEKIIMDVEDIKTISKYANKAVIIASHMDTVSHLTVTRQDIINLRLENVIIPKDNEQIQL